MGRASDAKEVGVENPAEETFRHPAISRMAYSGSWVNLELPAFFAVSGIYAHFCMTELSSTDARTIVAAQGWLELGSCLDANHELDGIAPDYQTHPDVLDMRWRIFAQARNWPACLDMGKTLIELAPQRAQSWIHCAFALHELKQTQEAWDMLSPKAQAFPNEPTIPYNLACYAAQLGQLSEAREWLGQAFKLGNAKALKLRAMNDPDLAPLWLGGEESAGE